MSAREEKNGWLNASVEIEAGFGSSRRSPSPRPSPAGRGRTSASARSAVASLSAGSGVRFSLSSGERAGVRGKVLFARLASPDFETIPLSLAPGFSRVSVPAARGNRFNGFPVVRRAQVPATESRQTVAHGVSCGMAAPRARAAARRQNFVEQQPASVAPLGLSRSSRATQGSRLGLLSAAAPQLADIALRRVTRLQRWCPIPTELPGASLQAGEWRAFRPKSCRTIRPHAASVFTR